jgi:hypothetical protein
MTHDDDTFWDAVHAALDDRRDPLDDERVRAMLDAAPERRDALLRLEGRLAGVAAFTVPAAKRHLPPIVVVASAAAALVVAVVAYAWWNRDAGTTPAPSPRPVCEVLHFERDFTFHARRTVVTPPASGADGFLLSFTTSTETTRASR